MTKVDITTAGHTVIVEADADLEAVAAKALELWQQTRDPKLDKASGTAGFQAEQTRGEYVSGYDADLGRPR